MNIPFLDNWRKRHTPEPTGSPLVAAFDRDPDGVAELLAECELLRARVAQSGVALDDTLTPSRSSTSCHPAGVTTRRNCPGSGTTPGSTSAP